jgi:ABC-2 type transport system permease protein
MWFAGCFVAPRLTSAIVMNRLPGPTAAEFDVAVQRARDRLPKWPDRVAAVEARFLSGELPADPELPSNPEVIALVDAERDETALYEQLFADLFTAAGGQTDTYERAAWLFPTIGMQAVSMGLAGTDYRLHRQFVEATREYRTAFLDLLNRELIAYREVNTFDYTRGRELWERIPEFRFEPPTAWTTLQRQWQPIAGLMVWLVVATIVLFASVGSMELR